MVAGWLIKGSLEGAWVHYQLVGGQCVAAQARHHVGARMEKEHPKQRSAADAQ